MSSANTNRGVQICVESLNEFKIKDINFDGTENYIEPPKFKDVISKNANNIPWRKIVGNESSLDVEKYSDEENDQNEGTKKKVATMASVGPEPEAGPWSAVAKCLHRSLNEVNLLLDSLQVIKKGCSQSQDSSTKYLAPVCVALPPDTEKVEYKVFQLCAKKKALSSAAKCIELAKNSRLDDGPDSSKTIFFNDLKKMREKWRIRKVGPITYGDLSYRIYGPKFNANEIFDIVRESSSKKHDQSTDPAECSSSLTVQVPRDLERRTRLCVFILVDNAGNNSSLFSKDFDCVKNEGGRNVHWEKALKWAQQSLICKDLFTRLVKESVIHERVCLVADNHLLISLGQDYYLKIERRFYPFDDSELEDAGIPYLNRTLHELFLTDILRKKSRPQQFVCPPQTSLSENMDLRGPRAFSSEEIAARMPQPTTLLSRFVQRSAHYLTVRKVVKVLEVYQQKHPDPLIQWKWTRCSPIFSSISLSMFNQSFENIGKFIRIKETEVTVVNKDYQQINSYDKDVDLLGRVILLLASTYFLNTVNMHSRIYGWQMLHMNNNALDDSGHAPTFYACNQYSTKHIFIQFHTNGSPPSVFMKQNLCPTTKVEEAENELHGFKRFGYEKIYGTSFMRKIDFILSIFSS